jgi:hypothetical protein
VALNSSKESGGFFLEKILGFSKKNKPGPHSDGYKAEAHTCTWYLYEAFLGLSFT